MATFYPPDCLPTDRLPTIRLTDWRAVLFVTTLLVNSGCQLTPTPLGSTELDGLSAELAELETLVTATRADLQQLSTAQDASMDSVNRRLRTIDGGVKRVPNLIENACQRPANTVTPTCDEIAVQTILVDDDKMIVGALEHLWVNPPGLNLQTRIDTGTASNTIHATDIESFERDGTNWVRFNLWRASDDDSDSEDDTATVEAIAVERKIVRLLRNSKRPVVSLSIRLGNVFDSFDFILSDRSNQDYPVVLGRNFLQDIALVDVGKEFVQPRFDNSNKNSETGSASSGR